VLAALAGAVKTFGGHVEKITGDGIMAVFGARSAHEDDPEPGAVRAALPAASGTAVDGRRTRGARLGPAVGVNSGEVVAGRAGGME